jgi:molecular chaperone GrpE
MSAENGSNPPEEAAPDEGAEIETVEALKAEIAALRDRSLRALAEADNTRKRAERERDESRQYAVTRFARDLLTVADNLARALTACPPEARAEANESLKAVIDGVEATERELQNILTRNGVKPIEAAGARFDPHLHQAIAEVPGDGQAAGTVVNVVQSGYTIGERLLRPAMVTVARAGEPARSPESGEPSAAQN